VIQVVPMALKMDLSVQMGHQTGLQMGTTEFISQMKIYGKWMVVNDIKTFSFGLIWAIFEV
jgi:hypothetical protein